MADKERVKEMIIRIALGTVCSVAFIGISDGLYGLADKLEPKVPGAIAYKQVDAPESSNENGVVTADE